MALNQGKYRRAKGSEQKMSIYYCKDMFKVKNMEEAKKIILTEERQGGNYAARWERETVYMLELVGEAISIVEEHWCKVYQTKC